MGPPLGVALLVLASVPGAAAAPAVVTLRAPFAPSHSGASNVTNLTGCGAAYLVPPRAWNASTGAYAIGAKAHSTACPSGTASFDLEAVEVNVGIPVSFATNGTHQIQVAWNLTDVVAVATVAGSCSAGGSGGSCFQAAYVAIFGGAELFDAAAHAFLNGSTIWSSARFTSGDTFCMSGACTVSTSSGGTPGSSETSSMYATVTAGHHYYVELSFTVEVYTYDSVNGATSTGSSATASVLPGPSGSVAQLESIQLR